MGYDRQLWRLTARPDGAVVSCSKVSRIDLKKRILGDLIKKG
jgi:hypothetical protein